MTVFDPQMMQGKVVLVTGGGTGIGKGIARLFAEHGAHAVICSRKQDVLQATAAELHDAGLACDYHVCDIRDYAQVEAMMARIIEQRGSLDVLVNNAAGNFPATIAQLSANGFRTVVDIDLNGTFNVSRAAYSAWLAEHGGAVVNITAPFAGWGVAYQAHAAAAKAGVDSLTRTCAVEWRNKGIRVNAVAPGSVADTEGLARLSEALTGDAEPELQCQPGDIANAVLFLASDAARFISGEIIRVDSATGVDMLNMPVE